MGDININGDRNTVVVGQRAGIGVFGTFWLIVALFWLWQHIVVILAILAFAGVMCLIAWAVMLQDSAREERAAGKRALAARADAQHKATMDGRTRYGTYGEFPPAC